jgi:hypothetical protein
MIPGLIKLTVWRERKTSDKHLISYFGKNHSKHSKHTATEGPMWWQGELNRMIRGGFFEGSDTETGTQVLTKVYL